MWEKSEKYRELIKKTSDSLMAMSDAEFEEKMEIAKNDPLTKILEYLYCDLYCDLYENEHQKKGQDEMKTEELETAKILVGKSFFGIPVEMLTIAVSWVVSFILAKYGISTKDFSEIILKADAEMVNKFNEMHQLILGIISVFLGIGGSAYGLRSLASRERQNIELAKAVTSYNDAVKEKVILERSIQERMRNVPFMASPVEEHQGGKYDISFTTTDIDKTAK